MAAACQISEATRPPYGAECFLAAAQELEIVRRQRSVNHHDVFGRGHGGAERVSKRRRKFPRQEHAADRWGSDRLSYNRRVYPGGRRMAVPGKHPLAIAFRRKFERRLPIGER